MKCPNCGNEVVEGQQYCPSCGHKLSKEATNEQDSVGSEEESAASARPNICPVCGSPLPENSVFCPNCGTRLFSTDNTTADKTVTVPDAHAQAEGRARNAGTTQAMPVIPDDADAQATRPATPPLQDSPTQVAPRATAPQPVTAPRRATAAPSPARTSGNSAKASNSRGTHRGPRIAIVTVCCAVIVISLAVIVSVAAGVGPFAGTSSDTSAQQSTATETTTSDADSSDTGDADASSTSDATAADNSSSTAATSNSSTATNTSSDTSDSSQSADSSSSTNDNAASTTSGTVSLSGDGTVSSTAGYTLTVPTTYSIQSSDASGNVVLTDSQSPCTISVTINPNTNGIDTETAYEQATRGVSDSAYTTTARDMSWYVVSDDTGSSSYYVMSYVEPSRIVTLRFDYPSSSQSTSGPIIESVQPTFKVS